MKNKQSNYVHIERQGAKYAYIMIVLASLVVLNLTFLSAISSMSYMVKILCFAGFVLFFLGFSYFIHSKYSRPGDQDKGEKADEEVDTAPDSIFTKQVEAELLVLDEAGKFFSASLKTDDMFRLIASRIGEVILHSTSALFMVDAENHLKVSYAAGENAREFTKVFLECDEGIAGRAFISETAELSKNLKSEKRHVDRGLLGEADSAVAVSLKRGVSSFGVLVLYGNGFSEKEQRLLEAIGERVSPLLVSSFSFEQNISNSMTDALTNLPNERAFYLVLENQIAEAQRFQEERPLTILTLDIQDFADFNRIYGHSTGDSLLAFASSVIGDQLRQMDFLARSMSDEFWVVLPTASDEITKKIIKRIEEAFTKTAFEISNIENYYATMNFGSATFLRDGETTNQLLQKALLRKKHSKSGNESSVIMFPREYVN